jgi:hypothetical protein
MALRAHGVLGMASASESEANTVELALTVDSEHGFLTENTKSIEKDGTSKGAKKWQRSARLRYLTVAHLPCLTGVDIIAPRCSDAS